MAQACIVLSLSTSLHSYLFAIKQTVKRRTDKAKGSKGWISVIVTAVITTLLLCSLKISFSSVRWIFFFFLTGALWLLLLWCWSDRSAVVLAVGYSCHARSQWGRPRWNLHLSESSQLWRSARDLFPGPVSEAELMKGPRVARHLYAAVSVWPVQPKKKKKKRFIFLVFSWLWASDDLTVWCLGQDFKDADLPSSSLSHHTEGRFDGSNWRLSVKGKLRA